MRKLASVQRIAALDPIPGRDRIEVATILGWRCIVQKGMKVGDLVVYHEVDSVVPLDSLMHTSDPPLEGVERVRVSNNGVYDFMRALKGRVRTIRMAGVYSQGIAIPLEAFGAALEGLVEGDDLTRRLGVTKWAPPDSHHDAFDAMPACVPRTKSTRLQSVPGILEELSGRVVSITRKLDGTSCTVMRRPAGADDVLVCGHHKIIPHPSTDATMTSNVYWQAVRASPLFQALAREERAYAVQGEVFGGAFHAFDVFDLDAQEYLAFDDFRAFCERHRITTVPVLHDFLVLGRVTVDDVVRMAVDECGTDEGIVIRPRVQYQSAHVPGRVSLKVISPAYLVKAGA